MSETALGPPKQESARDLVRESLVTGLAVLVPALVTVFVLTFLFNAIYRYLRLVSGYIPPRLSVVVVPGAVALSARTVLELLVPVVFVVGTFWIGLLVNRWRYGERLVDYFDAVITRVPGVGAIYESFRQMSDVVLEGDEESFREVKLVEFPHEDSYTLGFVTTETPEELADPTSHDELVTMFLPMAPNPVMGGHLVHLPTERVMDVDLTVEEGVQTIVTSGVALADGQSASLSPEELRGLAAAEQPAGRFGPRSPSPYLASRDRFAEERSTRYDENVDPQFAERPTDLVERARGNERASTEDVDGSRPADRAGREPEGSARTEGRPAELADRPPEAREVTEGRPAELAGEEAAGTSTDASGEDPDQTASADSVDPVDPERASDGEAKRTDAASSDREEWP